MKKDFFKEKKNVITLVVVIVLILVVVLVAVLTTREEKVRFTLNSIYDVYPEEVRELYTNMVSVSCIGDLYLDLEVDKEATNVENMEATNLLDYLFSYLDKEEKLKNNMDAKVVSDASYLLFYGDLNLTSKVVNYPYGEYVYTLKDGVITREKKECISNVQYVSQLYGYSYNENLLSVDVNMGYLKDGYLYDFEDKSLGAYDGKVEKLAELYAGNSFYRYNFVKDGSDYKLTSVEWLNKS